jgi:hypothetical protein
LRTAEELEQLIRNCPFSEEEISHAESLSDVECFYVSLLAQAPQQESLNNLSVLKSEDEKYQIAGRDALRPQSMPENMANYFPSTVLYFTNSMGMGRISETGKCCPM